MCLKAVKYNGNNLKYVNPELQTKNVIETALENDPDSIMFVFDNEEE